jgi:hypothetical protein
MTRVSPVMRGGRKFAFPDIPYEFKRVHRLIQPCAGRIPRRRGSTGSPIEKVRLKIPITAQIIAEITKEAVTNSPRLLNRPRMMKTAAVAIRRIAIRPYLLGIFSFIRLTLFIPHADTAIPFTIFISEWY